MFFIDPSDERVRLIFFFFFKLSGSQQVAWRRDIPENFFFFFSVENWKSHGIVCLKSVTKTQVEKKNRMGEIFLVEIRLRCVGQDSGILWSYAWTRKSAWEPRGKRTRRSLCCDGFFMVLTLKSAGAAGRYIPLAARRRRCQYSKLGHNSIGRVPSWIKLASAQGRPVIRASGAAARNVKL